MDAVKVLVNVIGTGTGCALAHYLAENVLHLGPTGQLILALFCGGAGNAIGLFQDPPWQEPKQ